MPNEEDRAQLELTRFLRDPAGAGVSEQQAAEQVHHVLHAIAQARLGRGHGASLQATELVSEAWLRLFPDGGPEVRNRAHFFALASRAMRQLLVDRYRARSADKRGGSDLVITLDEGLIASSAQPLDLEGIDQALDELTALDERGARVVEMRFFGGLSMEETADALEISVSTAERDWRHSRAWLANRLGRGEQA